MLPEAKAQPTRAKKRELTPFAPGVGDVMLRYDEYPHPTDGTLYRNWIALCPFHHDCSKSRKHIPSFCAKFGAIEPVAFLHTWAALGEGTPKEGHSTIRMRMHTAKVDEFVLAHRAELEVIVADVGPKD